MTKHETGLAAIARSTRRVRREADPSRDPAWVTDAKPPLEFEGRHQKTSLTLDTGMWDCVLETAHALTKRMRATGRGRVTLVDILESAFVAFHELSLEQQLDLVRKHR
jgi:hypothetical protein